MKEILLRGSLFLAFCSAAIAQSVSSQCPEIRLVMINAKAREKEVVVFVAEVGKATNKEELKYKWLAQNLEIIEGQGTKYLTTRRKSDDIGTATVTIEGFAKGCSDSGSETAPAVDPPLSILIDEFEKETIGEVKSKLDNLSRELQKRPEAQALIVIHRNYDSVNIASMIYKVITLRKMDDTRISFMFTSEPKNLTQLYVIPAWASKPEFDDSISLSLADFDKLRKMFSKAKFRAK